MSRYLKVLSGLVLGLGLLGLPSVAHAVVGASDAQNLQVIQTFRNVSGATQTSGTTYVYQTANNDANVVIGYTKGRGSSLGRDVTTTTTADSQLAAGVQVDDTCLNNADCRLVTYGPVIVRWAGLTDNTNSRGGGVGTTTIAGRAGTGSRLGVLLSLSLGDPGTGTSATENNGVTDVDNRWIFVTVNNAD